MARTTEIWDAAYFTLNLSLDMSSDIEITDEVEDEVRENINKMIEEAQLMEETQNETNSMDDFQSKDEGRHVKVTEQDLDDYADENIAPSTREQTRWAVKIFKGKFTQLLSIFF